MPHRKVSEPIQYKSVASHEAMEALWDLQSELNDLVYDLVKVTCRNLNWLNNPLIS